MNEQKDLIVNKYTSNIFENIKHVDQYGSEYWYAREFSKVLEYNDWRNFKKVIDKAIMSANNSIQGNEDWVVEVNKPITTGKGKQEYDSLSEDEKRFYQRKLTRCGNYTLQKVDSSAGVKNMAEFHNAGYRGLYNGETADDIFKNYVIEKIF